MEARRFLTVCVGIGLLAGIALTARSQAKPEVLVKQRQAAMTLQGKYFGPLAGMARGTLAYDAQVVARNVRYLEALSTMPWDGFVESTQSQESRALPALWADPAGFRSSAEQFESAVAALVTAASGSDETAVKTAIENVGKTCGGCHDDFRRK